MRSLKDRREYPAQEGKESKSIRSVLEAARRPRQVLLEGAGESEVAQNSYKGFKESREEFLRRLLDPPLTLEETARVLNVCPTTVRRYTNRGLLKHFRTAGNQRRFRLSQVFAFMEEHMGGKGRTMEQG